MILRGAVADRRIRPDAWYGAERLNIAIGGRARQRRDELQFDAAQVASRLAVHVDQLHAMERGQVRPRADQLVNLAVILGVSIAYFFEAPEHPSP